MDEQARAARLTAIAERLKAAQASFQCRVDYAEPDDADTISRAESKALVGLFADASAHVETLTQQVAEYRAAAGGRDADEFAVKDRIRTAEHNLLVQENARLTAEMRKIESVLQAGIPDCIVGNFPKQTAQFAVAAFQQAEQQRDAAHAALKRIRGWDMLDATADGPFWKRELDAALAASAPQKANCEGGACKDHYGDSDAWCPRCRASIAPAPAQETER